MGLGPPHERSSVAWSHDAPSRPRRRTARVGSCSSSRTPPRSTERFSRRRSRTSHPGSVTWGAIDGVMLSRGFERARRGPRGKRSWVYFRRAPKPEPEPAPKPAPEGSPRHARPGTPHGHIRAARALARDRRAVRRRGERSSDRRVVGLTSASEDIGRPGPRAAGWIFCPPSPKHIRSR